MATTSTSTAVVAVESVFTGPERLALAGFLAGYTGLTREAYALDLRQYASWCRQNNIGLFQARRADIECFARDLEARGRARATITRRLCTVAGFYRYAVEEELLDHSPAAHVRRPRLDYESHATGLDRNELGALLVAASLGHPTEHALISLLALNGLRVSEATGASIEALGVERGHRTLVVTRKGGKVVTVPLAPRTARAIDLAVGERSEGPVFLAADGGRLDRHGAGRIVRRVARRARSPSCHPAPAAAVSRSTCAQLRRCPPSSAGVLLTHLSVHEPVDDLCKKAAGLCTRGKCWGLSRRRTPISEPSPAKTPFTPCAQKKKRSCPHDTPQWQIKRLNIYRKFIRL